MAKTLLRDKILTLGRYSLVIHRGSALSVNDQGAVYEGGFTYSSGACSFCGDRVTVDLDDVYHFEIQISRTADPGLAICYAMDSQDPLLQRKTAASLTSPVFLWEQPVRAQVSFFPETTGKTRNLDGKNAVTLSDPVTVPTCFSTIYEKQIFLALPAGFAFRLAACPDQCKNPRYYYSPHGQARVVTAGNLRLGLSGSEYAALKENHRILFHPGYPSFYGNIPDETLFTTSRLSFPDSGCYTQPQNAPFYGDTGEIRRHKPLAAIQIPDAVIPIFPYSNSLGDRKTAELMETLHLSPDRRANIQRSFSTDRALTAQEDSFFITRNGMKACMRGDRLYWLRPVPAQETEPAMAFTQLTPAFMLGLLSSDLFLILPKLTGLAESPYIINAKRLSQATLLGYPDASKWQPLFDTCYPSKARLAQAADSVAASVTPALLNGCNTFNLWIAGWRFLLYPDDWEENETLFLLKMDAAQSVADRISAPESYSLSLSDQDQKTVKKRIAPVFRRCETSDDPILSKLLYDKNWRGAAFFHAGVDVSSFPEELTFLAKGICPESFKALYAAFPAQGILDGEQALPHCLIAYSDPQPLQFEEETEFGFKVTDLRVKIENGAVGGFRAQAQLFIHYLFGSPAAGQNGSSGNSLIFEGEMQKDDGGICYIFHLKGTNTFSLCESLISSVRITSAVLRMEGRLCHFILGGEMLLSCRADMDILSYDAIGFDGLKLIMDSAGSSYTFSLSYETFHFLPDSAKARENSFAFGFPARIGALLAAQTCPPHLAGYEPLNVKGAVDEDDLGEIWYGITWECQAGNLGGLAAAMDVTLILLTAWNREKKLYCGIRITSVLSDGGFLLPLQGVMELRFKRTELHHKNNWYFRFRDFTLTVLGKSFPDTGANLYLITDQQKNLGFYGVMEE